MIKILICGRSGSGKSLLANYLKEFFNFTYFNGDTIRELTQNYDFTITGRIKQTETMKHLAENCGGKIVVCDFICPTKELRKIFTPDIIVYCVHKGSGKYKDTDSIFQEVEQSEATNVFQFERGNEEQVVQEILKLCINNGNLGSVVKL